MELEFIIFDNQIQRVRFLHICIENIIPVNYLLKSLKFYQLPPPPFLL